MFHELTPAADPFHEKDIVHSDEPHHRNQELDVGSLSGGEVQEALTQEAGGELALEIRRQDVAQKVAGRTVTAGSFEVLNEQDTGPEEPDGAHDIVEGRTGDEVQNTERELDETPSAGGADGGSHSGGNDGGSRGSTTEAGDDDENDDPAKGEHADSFPNIDSARLDTKADLEQVGDEVVAPINAGKDAGSALDDTSRESLQGSLLLARGVREGSPAERSDELGLGDSGDAHENGGLWIEIPDGAELPPHAELYVEIGVGFMIGYDADKVFDPDDLYVAIDNGHDTGGATEADAADQARREFQAATRSFSRSKPDTQLPQIAFCLADGSNSGMPGGSARQVLLANVLTSPYLTPNIPVESDEPPEDVARDGNTPIMFPYAGRRYWAIDELGETRKALLQEAARLVKPGGSVVINSYITPSMVNHQQVAAWFQARGFSVELLAPGDEQWEEKAADFRGTGANSTDTTNRLLIATKPVENITQPQ